MWLGPAVTIKTPFSSAKNSRFQIIPIPQEYQSNMHKTILDSVNNYTNGGYSSQNQKHIPLTSKSLVAFCGTVGTVTVHWYLPVAFV